MPRSGSLFWTLSGAFLGVLLLATLLQVIVVLTIVEPAARRAEVERAELQLEAMAERITTAREDGRSRDVARTLVRANRPGAPLRIVLRGSDGRWFGAGGRGTARRLDRAWSAHVGDDVAPDPGPRRDGRGGPPEPALAIVATLDLDDGTTLCAIQPVRRLEIARFLPRQAMIFLPLALVVAAGAGFFLSHRIQRRLRRLEALAARVGEGDLDARIDRPGDDEIGRLGHRLNDMTDRLARARDDLDRVQAERRRLLADISHDLATPLTAIRGYAETLLDPAVRVEPDDRERYLRDVLYASQRMDRLLGDLLDLGRLEAGTHALDRVDLDLAALARNCTERFVPLFEREGRTLRWEGVDDAVPVSGDGLRLEQVFDNLLANAARHVPAGGTVRVGVRDGGSRARIEVVDDGPGFDPTDLPHVFERFYRGDRARSTTGTGLGLAIVQQIARAHGGDAYAENVEPTGARLIVELPTGRD